LPEGQKITYGTEVR